MWRVCLLFVAVSVCGASETVRGESASADGPLTVTPLGSIRGSWMQTRSGRWFQAYRGIRYAEAPVGELRFQPPRPITKYSGEVVATADGPACPLPASPDYYVDEDCLTINVYTPCNNRSKKMPVIFFIHPGGFYSMTGRSDLAGPHYLMEREVVFVSINYRLATLGFLATGDELAPGNNGMKDQVVALKWVQKNIASFGGDPDSVTITGVSAGAISVMLHMISPMTKGLFHRGISISGSPLNKAPHPTHQQHLAQQQARILNCPSNSTKDIVDCLRTKSWQELGQSLPKFSVIGADPVGLWGPVVEPDFGQERYLDVDPVWAVQNGCMHPVPHIISQTTEEFSWFASLILNNATSLERYNREFDRLAPISFLLPLEGNETSKKVARLRKEYLNDKPLANDEESLRNMGRLYVDSIVGFPTHRMVTLMSKHSPLPVYYYEFAYVGNHSFWEDPKTKKPVGAMHHDDMLYLLTLSFMFPQVELGTKDDLTVQRMTAIWYNFARYGDPNPKGDTPELGNLTWPRYTPAAHKYLRIGDDLTVKENYKEDHYKIWEELYPLQPWPLLNK